MLAWIFFLRAAGPRGQCKPLETNLISHVMFIFQQDSSIKINYTVGFNYSTYKDNCHWAQCMLPADLNEPQIAGPLTSTSLLDHINCNGGNSGAVGWEVFPASQHHSSIRTQQSTHNVSLINGKITWPSSSWRNVATRWRARRLLLLKKKTQVS
jgi:hypothetical protein